MSECFAFDEEEHLGKLIKISDHQTQPEVSETDRLSDELLTALSQGSHSDVLNLTCFFDEGFDFRNIAGFEKAVKEFFLRNLEDPNLIPFVADFIRNEIGKGIDFSEEIKQTYDYWCSQLEDGENCEDRLEDMETLFGETTDLTPNKIRHMRSRVRALVQNTFDQFSTINNTEEVRKAFLDALSKIK